MKSINRLKILALFLVAAYLLSACSGTQPASATQAGGPKVEANVVAFTGVVEAMDHAEWTIGGQKLMLDPQASLDSNIAVGDQVRVQGHVTADGAVIALKIESSKTEDLVSTASVDASPTPNANHTPVASASPSADLGSNEVFGTVEALTADSVTINGVTYNLASSSEVKEMLKVGDPVKLHVVLNADGTLTVREIERSAAGSSGGNSSLSGSHDGPHHDFSDNHSQGSSSDDGPNHDANDDHGGNGGTSGSGGGYGDD